MRRHQAFALAPVGQHLGGPAAPKVAAGEVMSSAGTQHSSAAIARNQGLTLVPISAQLELFCPPYDPTSLMNVSWSCSS